MMKLLSLVLLLALALCSKGGKPVYTQVTCLYDLSAVDPKYDFKSDLSFFDMLLGSNSNLIIYG
jgi:hypothetical protein